MKIRFAFARPRPIARDNEGGTGDGTPAPSDDQTPTSPAPSGERTFSQADVDKIVTSRVKKLKEQLSTTEQQYERLLQNQNLSSQERTELEGQLEAVQAQLRTREQQIAHEAKQREAKFTATLEEATGERDRYKGLFETQTRDNAILSAATQHDAYNPEQFIAVLGPRTKIVEEVNGQGEKTGRLVPRVEIEVTGEDGSTSVELRPVVDAVEQMKNQPELYGNLFRSNVAKGIGEGSNPNVANPGRIDASKMSDAEYFANRDQIAERMGFNRKRHGL